MQGNVSLKSDHKGTRSLRKEEGDFHCEQTDNSPITRIIFQLKLQQPAVCHYHGFYEMS